MTRIFPSFAYSAGPRNGCWWDNTAELPTHPRLEGDVTCDVAIVGGGFTGLSAALHLAQEGARVVLLEAQQVGWGASGRNGGFCCLGGGMRGDASLDRTYGIAARRAWRMAERAAVEGVDALIRGLDINVDRHSVGETCLAHRHRDAVAFTAEAQAIRENYGVEAKVLSATDLKAAGMSGPFHGGITVPIGFGLNPRKLLAGLVHACANVGVAFHGDSAALKIGAGRVTTSKGVVYAPQVIVATNGYSSEDVPTWLAGRYMPAQSTVLVTRPLSAEDVQAQGWTSDQMAYDTRHLLHYFRLMPDGRFLFGMRGGLRASPPAEDAARAAVIHDFRKMFPAWQAVEVANVWSGMVCLARNRLPFVGPVPGMPGVFTGFAYHGNGIAMGIHVGSILAALAHGRRAAHYPDVMARPAKRFPFGVARRAVMPGIYAAFKIADALP
ncbi:FAD-binding oxidoreductase [uncultured Tateyamaria sp.]|uniref:NAD(P)/FAD-dependent oxidoreductase n=1 Tax=uncultured Tateyamaria sp. TaxID=455651 RepID=UPI00262D2F15|nr:FAD-binding oxidoreductase [uncultured Tateyamaria sp.]